MGASVPRGRVTVRGQRGQAGGHRPSPRPSQSQQEVRLGQNYRPGEPPKLQSFLFYRKNRVKEANEMFPSVGTPDTLGRTPQDTALHGQ